MVFLFWPLTFDLSTERSLWLSSAFIWEKYWKLMFFFDDYWWLIYYIWHRNFINNENILMSRSVDDLWPLFQGPMNSHFKQLLLWNPRPSCDHISYLTSWGLENKNLFKWSQSADQDGHQAHIWWKPSENLFQNQETGNLETLYKA